MNVKYWSNFYKRKNSTKQPLSGTTASVVLKHPTSLWEPEIECSGIPMTANYFMIPAGVFTQYDAYYFVTDIIAVTHAITRFKLTLDPAATYRTLIRASYQYVERANAPATFNSWITDDRNQPTNAVTISAASTTLKYGSNLDVFDLSTIRFLLSTVGAVTTIDYALMNGIAKTYILSGGVMALLASKLCTNAFLQDLVNEFTNPMESIVRCVALPVNLSGMEIHGSEPIFFGSYSTTVTANVLIGRVLISEVELTLPAGMTGQQTYLNHSPYCSATIYLPFIGTCPLDVDLVTGRRLKLKTVIDCFTGDITYAVKDYSSGVIYQTWSGKCGSDVPISSTSFSATGVISGILTTIGGLASKNPIMAASGVMASAQSLESHSQVNGGYSSCIGGWQGTDAIVTLYKSDPAHYITDNAAEEGLPYGKRELLSNLSGYVLCRNGNVDIPGSDRDKESINAMLNSGIFIE